jgi:transcriptional regulator GlxA family with amidase domain
MRRRFEQVEGGFRGARQRALVDAAVARLRESTACVESIALELGYAAARSLRRFLKNSTGKTPQEIRDSVDEPGVSAVSEEAIYHRIEEVSALMERQ